MLLAPMDIGETDKVTVVVGALRHVYGTYPPISDYGLIGDCHGAALVSRDG